MKKRFFVGLLIAVILCTLSINAGAAGYDYTLSNLEVTSDSISVKVTKSLEAEGAARLYIAMYDDYNALIDIVSASVELEQGANTTITKTLYPNKAVTVKAFVWSNICTANSTTIYKTTRPSGEIEYGGEV